MRDQGQEGLASTHQRQVVAFIRDKDMAHKLFADIGPRYADRPGGYTRILKLGPSTATTPPWPASSSSEPDLRSSVSGPGRQPVAEAAASACCRRLPRCRLPWLRTPGRATYTVASALGSALERVLRHPVEMTCAGRTDAGVHAWGQVVTLDVRADADLARLQRSVNKMLAPTIAVREATWAPAGFDARRSALSRVYRYNLLCSEWPDPLNAATTWHVEDALTCARMRDGKRRLTGRARLLRRSAMRCRGNPAPLVRRVLRAEWSDLGAGRLCFEIEAVSFCHQMVRSIVGTVRRSWRRSPQGG